MPPAHRGVDFYTIDSASGQLLRQSSADAGRLVPVGGLGIAVLP